MPKQSGNPLWDCFQDNDEDASKLVCIHCKKSLSRCAEAVIKEPL